MHLRTSVTVCTSTWRDAGLSLSRQSRQSGNTKQHQATPGLMGRVNEPQAASTWKKGEFVTQDPYFLVPIVFPGYAYTL